jgi:hypothetical protein
MKLIDLFADRLLDTKLIEMAISRRDAIGELLAKQKPLNEHLIKYFYFEDQAKNHWMNEIYSFISDVNWLYLKPKSKKLSKEMYFEYLFEAYYGHGTNVLTGKIGNFTSGEYRNCQKSGLSIEQVWWAMKQFYTWLCPILESDKYQEMLKANNQFIENKLNELQKQASTLQ